MQQGHCSCKSVCFEFIGEPLTCYACHCTDCQTSSGSAFGLSMIVNTADLKVTSNQPDIVVEDVNGVQVEKHYCARCATSLWYTADEYPGIAALKPGTFDETGWFEPVAHLWLRSSQPWVKLGDNVAKYQKQPEMHELFELWSKSNSAN